MSGLKVTGLYDDPTQAGEVCVGNGPPIWFTMPHRRDIRYITLREKNTLVEIKVPLLSMQLHAFIPAFVAHQTDVFLEGDDFGDCGIPILELPEGGRFLEQMETSTVYAMVEESATYHISDGEVEIQLGYRQRFDRCTRYKNVRFLSMGDTLVGVRFVQLSQAQISEIRKGYESQKLQS